MCSLAKITISLKKTTNAKLFNLLCITVGDVEKKFYNLDTWYVWLDKLMPRKDLRAVLLKILLDQVKEIRPI
jgi:hypothetical protein